MMKRHHNKKAPPRLSRTSIQREFQQPNTYVFVDGSDLAINIPEYEDLDYINANLSRSLRKLTHFCRSFGPVREAYVFDDTWQFISQEMWSRDNYECIDVPQDTNEDTRVSSVMTLRAFQTSLRLSGDVLLIFVVGGSSYKELLTEVGRRGQRTMLIGIDEFLNNDVKWSADVWVPINQAIPYIKPVKKNEGASQVVKDYKWDDFIELMNSLQTSGLDFVGVKHLINKVFPEKGVRVKEAHAIVEEAVDRDLIEMYQVDNPNGGYPVRACRLKEENEFVTSVLHRGAPAPG